MQMNNPLVQTMLKDTLKGMLKDKSITILNKVEILGIPATLVELNLKLDESIIYGKVAVTGKLESDLLNLESELNAKEKS